MPTDTHTHSKRTALQPAQRLWQLHSQRQLQRQLRFSTAALATQLRQHSQGQAHPSQHAIYDVILQPHAAPAIAAQPLSSQRAGRTGRHTTRNGEKDIRDGAKRKLCRLVQLSSAVMQHLQNVANVYCRKKEGKKSEAELKLRAKKLVLFLSLSLLSLCSVYSVCNGCLSLCV